MAVDTLNVCAAAAVGARCHAGNKAECPDLVVGWPDTVVVRALFAVGALVAQVVSVAQLHLFDAVDFGLIVVLRGRVDTLSDPIARDDFVPVHGLVCRRCGYGCWRWWSCCLRSPSTDNCGWLDGGIMIGCQG